MASKSTLGAQRAEAVAPLAADARIAEGDEHSAGCRLRKQSGLHGQRHVLREAARFHFAGHFFHANGQLRGKPVQRWVHPFGRGQLMRQRGGGIGLAQGAQQVDGHDVARAFPDAVERHLAVDARHHAFTALLHITVAAQTLHGFLGEVAAAFADPELGHGCEQAVHHLLVGVAGAVEAARQAKGERGRGFRFERQIGQHVFHQRLVDECLAKGLALRRVVERNAQRLAHQAAGAQGTVQPRHGAHGQDLRDAPALLTHQPGAGTDELHLGTRIGLVAQLVFQALDEELVHGTVGQHARQKEAAQTVGGLRQDQEGVAHGRGEKPLVAGDAEALAPGVAAGGFGARGVGAHVGSALLFGHAHAHGQAGLVAPDLERRLVGAAGEAGFPVPVDRGVVLERGGHRVAHGDGAQDGGLEFGEEHEAGGAQLVRVAGGLLLG